MFPLGAQLKERIMKVIGPIFHPLHVPYLMMGDLDAWKSFPAWLSSFSKGYSLLREEQPWLPFKATEWLRRYLNRGMRVFEYGAGGSTLFLAAHAGQVFSVEHDPEWHRIVAKALSERAIENCSYQLREARAVTGPPSAAASNEPAGFICDPSEREHPCLDFEEYVRAIDAHPDYTLDLVLVDGRARAACIDRALPKVRAGGYLVLDNSNDYRMAGHLGVMDPYRRIDFHGVAPGWPPARWTTSAWQILGGRSERAF
jgi:hypothetical protein